MSTTKVNGIKKPASKATAKTTTKNPVTKKAKPIVASSGKSKSTLEALLKKADALRAHIVKELDKL